MNRLPLSADTCARSCEDLSGDVFKQLLGKLQACPAWSIALDESTERSDIAQLLVSMQYFDNCVSEDKLAWNKKTSWHGTTLFQFARILHWLSHGAVLKRFVALLPHIISFLEEIGRPVTKLDTQFQIRLCFLADIFRHLNKLNMLLQGRQNLLCILYEAVNGFDGFFVFSKFMQRAATFCISGSREKSAAKPRHARKTPSGCLSVC